MKLARHAWAPLVLMGHVLACSDPSQTVPAGTEGDAGTDASPEGASLSGVMQNVDGIPLQAALALCADACWVAFTDDHGEFLYEGLPDGPYKLDVRAKPEAAETFAALSFPLQLTPSEDLVLNDPLVLPDTDAAIPLTGGQQIVGRAVASAIVL